MFENWPLWAIVIGYILFIVIKGASKARKISDADDFLIAGRNVGWFFLFCTMGATVIGGGASVGAIGKTYDWGILMLLVSTGWYLHLIFSGLVVAPKFREAELYTVAGYFGHRFGEGPRFMALLLSLAFSIFIVAAQMAAFGSVLTAIAPDFAEAREMLTWSILIGGTIVVIYSTLGGLLAVIHTDVYQFVILVIGFIITLGFCVPDIVGSWDRITDNIKPSFFKLDGGRGWLFAITTFLAFFLGETFAPGYATRYCVGKNIKETRKGIAGVGFFLTIFFPVVLFFIALYARIHFPEIDPQQALPMVIKQLNNPVISGLIIGALLMAVMSSADSALNSSTTIFVKDLFEHQLGWEDKGDGKTLRLARYCTVGLGLSAILCAAAWPDIIGLLLLTYHLWAPAVILPVIVGVYSKEKSPQHNRIILITMIVSVAGTLAYRFTEWSDKLDPSVFGVLLSCLIYFSARPLQSVFSRHAGRDN